MFQKLRQIHEEFEVFEFHLIYSLFSLVGEIIHLLKLDFFLKGFGCDHFFLCPVSIVFYVKKAEESHGVFTCIQQVGGASARSFF